MKPLRSWSALIVLALAVAVLATGVYAVVRSDGPPEPTAPPASSPTGDVPTAPPSPPVTTPVPPTKTPIVRPPEPPDVTFPTPPAPTLPPAPDVGLAVPVAAYQLAGAPDRLRLHYYIGVPECYGVVDPERGVTVTETVDAVRVLLQRTPPRSDPDTACIDIALARTVTVELQRPLGARAVIDASTGEPIPQGRT